MAENEEFQERILMLRNPSTTDFSSLTTIGGVVKKKPRFSIAKGSSSDPIIKQGWMTKQGGRIKTWKLRFWRLSNSFLCYYKDASPGQSVIQAIPVRLISQVEESNIKPSKADRMVEIHTPIRVFYAEADSKSDRDDWIRCLRGAMTSHYAPRRPEPTPSPVPAPPTPKKVAAALPAEEPDTGPDDAAAQRLYGNSKSANADAARNADQETVVDVLVLSCTAQLRTFVACCAYQLPVESFSLVHVVHGLRHLIGIAKEAVEEMEREPREETVLIVARLTAGLSELSATMRAAAGLWPPPEALQGITTVAERIIEVMAELRRMVAPTVRRVQLQWQLQEQQLDEQQRLARGGSYIGGGGGGGGGGGSGGGGPRGGRPGHTKNKSSLSRIDDLAFSAAPFGSSAASSSSSSSTRGSVSSGSVHGRPSIGGGSSTAPPLGSSESMSGGASSEESFEAQGWSVFHVTAWLSRVGFERYRSAFEEHSIDGSALQHLTHEQLTGIVKNREHASLLLHRISKLRRDGIRRSLSQSSRVTAAAASARGDDAGGGGSATAAAAAAATATAGASAAAAAAAAGGGAGTGAGVGAAAGAEPRSPTDASAGGAAAAAARLAEQRKSGLLIRCESESLQRRDSPELAPAVPRAFDDCLAALHHALARVRAREKLEVMHVVTGVVMAAHEAISVGREQRGDVAVRVKRLQQTLPKLVQVLVDKAKTASSNFASLPDHHGMINAAQNISKELTRCGFPANTTSS